MNARRIVWQNYAQGFRSCKKADSVALYHAETSIEDLPIYVPGEPVEYARCFSKDAVDLQHVSPRHNVGYSCGRRNLTDVIVWLLFDIGEWQRTVQERISSFATDLNELTGGERAKFIVRSFLIAEVSSDQSSVCLTHRHERFTCLMMWHDRYVQTGVWLATTKKRKIDRVGHGWLCAFPIFDCRFPIDCPTNFSLSIVD